MADEKKEESKQENKAAEQPAALTVSTAPSKSTPMPNVSTDNALLREFVQMAKGEQDVRKQEIAYREKELGLREKEIDHAHEYAKEALNAQKEDYDGERKERRSERRDYLIGGIIILILVLAFIVFCLRTGHETIALETLKIGGTALLSGISMYFLGKSKGKEQAIEDDE